MLQSEGERQLVSSLCLLLLSQNVRKSGKRSLRRLASTTSLLSCLDLMTYWYSPLCIKSASNVSVIFLKTDVHVYHRDGDLWGQRGMVPSKIGGRGYSYFYHP